MPSSATPSTASSGTVLSSPSPSSFPSTSDSTVSSSSSSTSSASSASSSSSAVSPKIFERRVQFLAVGFLTLFLAYSSAQLLQTPLNKTLGYACLLTLYACFGVTGLIAPLVVDIYGPRQLLAVSAVGYVIMVASNLYPTPGLLIPGCIIVGICAATLWSSQGSYIGACAVQLSVRRNKPLTECTSQLNASFYSIFMLSGGISAIGASLIIMSVADAIKVLFFVLTIIGILGIVLLGSLPEANDDTDRWFIFPPWFMHLTVWRECLRWKRSGQDLTNKNGTVTAAAEGATVGTSAEKEKKDTDKPRLLLVGPADAVDHQEQWNELSLQPKDSTITITNQLQLSSASSDELNDDRTVNTGKEIIIDISSSASSFKEIVPNDTTSTTSTESTNHIHRTSSSVRRRNTNQEEENKSITNTLHSSPSSGNVSSSSASIPSPRPSLKFMVKFLLTNHRMRFIIPLIITTGAGSGFVSGAWYGGVVGRALGLEYVGFIGSLYSFTAAFATKGLWGKLAQRKTFGRRWCFVMAIIAHLCWYFSFALWSYSNIDTNPSTEIFTPGSSQRDGAYAMLFIGVFVYAMFDPVYNSFVPATLQAFFPSGPEAPCAMASIRVMYSFGFAGQQAISIALGQKYIAAQCVELFILLSLAASALFYLHRNICSIDSSGNSTNNASSSTDKDESSASAETVKKETEGKIEKTTEIEEW